jgi:hypothetical protein
MTYQLKDWLNSINHQKNDLMEEGASAKEYPAYIVNRCLSGDLDAIMFANEMNLNPNLDSDLQYYFLLNTLRKRKRFNPWLKKEKLEDLEVVKSYYGYSNEKAREVLSILNSEQLTYIRSRLDRGGKT